MPTISSWICGGTDHQHHLDLVEPFGVGRIRHRRKRWPPVRLPQRLERFSADVEDFADLAQAGLPGLLKDQSR